MHKHYNETRAEIRFINDVYMKLVEREVSGEAARRRPMISLRDESPMGFLRGYLQAVPNRHFWGGIVKEDAIAWVQHFLNVERERLKNVANSDPAFAGRVHP